MRTLHITNAWHETSGGVRTFYERLLIQANRAHRYMTLVVPGAASATTDVGAYGRIHTLAAPASPVFDRRYRIVLPHRYVWSRSALRQLIARERPDLVEVSDKYALVYLAGLLKIGLDPRPTIVGTTHERMDDHMAAHVSYSERARRFSRWYLAHIYVRQFDAHIANSDFTADELRQAIDAVGPSHPLIWRQRQRIRVVTPGVDAAGLHPGRRSEALRAALLARMGATSSASLLLFAGRLAREKYVRWLVPALAMVRQAGFDARLVIAGDGPERRAVEAAAAALTPGHVLCLGHQRDRTSLGELLASADLFLHPNPAEPFGIGPLEAMAAGTPVVVPAAGGVLSYSTAENAWLAVPSAEGLAAAVCDALRQSDVRRQRASAGVVTARRFNWPDASARFFETCDELHETRLTGWAHEATKLKRLLRGHRVPVTRGS